MKYKILFSRQAEKDLATISRSNLKSKALFLLNVLEEDPYQPPKEKLVDQDNTYSKRINIQHRLVYKIYEEEKTVMIIRMWTHYDKL